MSASLVKEIKEYKVSSVLNGDKKTYGKTFLFDGHDETCWNSDKGAPQRIDFRFNEPKTVTELRIQFQGGFAAKDVELQSVDDEEVTRSQFHPHDTNQFQEFRLSNPITATAFRINLNSSYDFYGRIIIYHLDILGK